MYYMQCIRCKFKIDMILLNCTKKNTIFDKNMYTKKVFFGKMSIAAVHFARIICQNRLCFYRGDLMRNIIDFGTYRKRGNIMDAINLQNDEKFLHCDGQVETMKEDMFEDLIEYLANNRKQGKENSMSDVDEVAEFILKCYGYKENGSVPINKIIKQFGILPYEEALDKNLSGDISINGDTYEKYQHDKVILVNEDDVLEHQRFVAAHELAHYLFDYIGSEAEEKKLFFRDTYEKDKHETVEEQRANRFAAAILMPRKVFIKKYNEAQSKGNGRVYLLMYLSRFFKTTINSIERRIQEVFWDRTYSGGVF